MNTDQSILIGKCMGAHGIQGGMKWRLLNPEDSSLEKGMLVEIEGKEYKIDKIQWGPRPIFYLAGVSTRNQSEELVGKEVMIKRSELPELAEDELYLNDLIGMKVFELDEEIGEVKKIYDNGVQDIAIINLTDGSQIDLLLQEPFLKHIDLENKQLQVERPTLI